MRTMALPRRTRASARSKVLGLLLLLAAPIPAAPIQTQIPSGRARSEGARVAQLMGEALREQSTLPGFAIAVGDEKGIVFSEAFGVADLSTGMPATPLTRWRIGSISKSLTAAGAVALVEQGQLDLDAPLVEFLPSWKGRPAGQVTARQLAGHLGGVRHYRKGEGVSYVHYDDVINALELFADDSLVAVPGTEYNYSTYGYSLLSAIIQRATGEPFLQWMDRELFEPLHMRHTGPDLVTALVPQRASFYELSDGRMRPAPFTNNSYKWAGGGFLSTAEDLVLFGHGLLKGRLLTKTGLDALFTSQRTVEGEQTGYGMGFRSREDREGRSVVHHGGSSEGGRAFLLLYPGQDVVVAMAANRATAPLFEQEAEGIAHFFIDHGRGTDGVVDREMAGTWSLKGTLGDSRVNGSVRLYESGGLRGLVEWGHDQTPIEVIVVDRHGPEIQLFGVGPHGLMRAWLHQAEGGLSGRWEYLGRTGSLEVRAAASGLGPQCRSGATLQGETSERAARSLERAQKVLRSLRSKVQFSNRPLPTMTIAQRMERYNVPGLAMAVVEDGKIAWTCAAGTKESGKGDSVTHETLFHAKSVSKAVSTLAAMRLVDQGRLELDTPLADRLRSYSVPDNEYTRTVPPTLRHLLSHSAGFTRHGVDSYMPGEPLPTVVQSLTGQPPAEVEPLSVDFTPGTRYRYSGGGYGVLQVLLQDVGGQPFPGLMEELVFVPAGMTRSLFPQPLPKVLRPFAAKGHDADGSALPGGFETLPIMAAGGLWTTATDLARYVVAIQAAWRGTDGSLLGRDLAQEMLEQEIGGWGLGVAVEGTKQMPFFSHGGSGDGFKALIVGLPSLGQGAVILANGDGAGELRYEILRSIAEEYDWPIHRGVSTYTLETGLKAGQLARFEGSYSWPGGTSTVVELREDGLYEQFNGGAWMRLFPLSANEFVTVDDERYRFVIASEGRRTVLEFTDATGTYEASRLPTPR